MNSDSISVLLAIHENIERELDDALDAADNLKVHPGDTRAREWAHAAWQTLRQRTLGHIDEEERKVFVHATELGITFKQIDQFRRAHDRLRALSRTLDDSPFLGSSNEEVSNAADTLDMFVHVYVTHADREERVLAAVRRVHADRA